MQTEIFFFSPFGAALLESIRNLAGWHHWTPDGKGYAFGVAIPNPGVDPMEVVDALTPKGVYVLPSVHDTATIPSAVATALAGHGVLPTDTAFQCAQKIHAVSGHPSMKPHRY